MCQTKMMTIMERFIEYFSQNVKTGLEITGEILCKLNSHGGNLDDCRGPSYNNADDT